MFRGYLSHNEPARGPVTAAHARGGGRRRRHPQRPPSLLPPPAAFSGAHPGDPGAAGTPSAALPPAEAAVPERLGLSLPAPCPGRGGASSTFFPGPRGPGQAATRNSGEPHPASTAHAHGPQAYTGNTLDSLPRIPLSVSASRKPA